MSLRSGRCADRLIALHGNLRCSARKYSRINDASSVIVQQAVHEHCEDDEADDDVEPVFLGKEGEGRKCDARDWRRDQQQQTELNDGAAVSGRKMRDDCGWAAEFWGFAVERRVVRARAACLA